MEDRSSIAWRLASSTAGVGWAYDPVMSLVSLVVLLIFVGVALYLVNNLIPMDAKIKTILNVVVVLAVCLWLLSAFGLLDMGPVVRVPRR